MVVLSEEKLDLMQTASEFVTNNPGIVYAKVGLDVLQAAEWLTVFFDEPGELELLKNPQNAAIGVGTEGSVEIELYYSP